MVLSLNILLFQIWCFENKILPVSQHTKISGDSVKSCATVVTEVCLEMVVYTSNSTRD